MGVTPAPHAVLTAYARYLIQLKARQICHKPSFSRSDEEDLVQELTTRLLAKAHLYDPSRGASINTFVNRVVSSELKMILRERRQKKRAAGFTAKSLSEAAAQPHGESVPLGDVISDADRERLTGFAPPHPRDRAELKEAIDHALAGLPARTMEIAKGLKPGKISAVAREMGTTRREVYAAMEQIRRRFEDAGLGLRRKASARPRSSTTRTA